MRDSLTSPFDYTPTEDEMTDERFWRFLSVLETMRSQRIPLTKSQTEILTDIYVEVGRLLKGAH